MLDGRMGGAVMPRSRLHRRSAIAVVPALMLALGPAARAAEAPSAGGGAAVSPAAGPTTAANLLAAADAAVDAGNLAVARVLFERVAAEFPGTAEAREARRASKIIAVRGAPPPAPAPPTAGAPDGSSDDIIVRGEPYSRRTSERLRLTTWEKLDFGVTAFLYGLSVGFSYALSLDNTNDSEALPAIAIGALTYTLGAVAFITTTNPDRGDLPLALSIVSYVPTTTLLVANVAFDHPDGKKTAIATAAAGVLSIPAAVIATRELDLDPGDTQLVRDAGFWGLALAITGMEGFGGSTQSFGTLGNGGTFTTYSAPPGHSVAAAGLVGLYGGLGLGALGAHFSNVSLERVRVSTWGGYGGAVIGLLLGAAAGSGGPSGLEDRDIYRGVCLGALGGLALTFISTGSLDGIPAEGQAPSLAAGPRLAPTMLELAGTDGRTHPGFGFAGFWF